MRYMGDTSGGLAVPTQLRAMTRAQLAAAMASAPPAAQLMTAEDLAFIVANADLLRDDYAEPLVLVASETSVGARQRMAHIGLGMLAGIALGALAVLAYREL